MLVMIGFSLSRAIAETAIYPWAQEFIRKRGGVLNVAWRLVCMG